VSARKPIATRQMRFLSRSIEATPCRSRAQEIVVTDAIDRAVWATGVTHDLTDAVMTEISEIGHDITELRSAVFTAIAYGIIDRIEFRVGTRTNISVDHSGFFLNVRLRET
jgi:hypothetical protein